MAGMTKYVIPPPALPQPAVRALDVPTTFLSKNPVDQTWHGTNDPPRIPMKNRITYKPAGVEIVPARAVGIAPRSKQAAKVNRSQAGPATRRTSRLHKPLANDLSLRVALLTLQLMR